MTHLSEEQFEDMLNGSLEEPAHLAECELCSNLLAERRAVRGRLKSAFTGIHAHAGLLESVRDKAASSPTGGTKVLHFVKWAMPLSAAALVLIGVSAFLLFSGPEPVEAASAELYRIHQHALSPHTELYSDADPELLAGFLKEELGFAPAVPKLGAGMSLRGCCVAYFQDKPVGSYVVETPRGVMSIIVIGERPELPGMKKQILRQDHVYMSGSFATSRIVTVHVNGYTYCAVGEVPEEYLTDLLEQLLWD